VTDARDLSRRTVLADLLVHRPTSRRDIAERTQLSPATVSRVTDTLISEGVVREAAEEVSDSRGRRAVLLDAVGERTLAAGIDLGAANVRLALGDALGNLTAFAAYPTPEGLDARALASWLLERVKALAASVGVEPSALAVGVPGAVSADRTVSNAPNLPQVEDPEFLAELDAGLGQPVELDNDVNLALLGEQCAGAARGKPSAAMLSVGAGLGAALAIEGRVLRGRHGLVGEFGQLPVGPLGARLEHMVTGPGILRRAEEAGVPLASPQELFDDSPRVSHLRAQFDSALGIVLTAIAVSTEPETIVLGGGIAASLVPSLARYRTELAASLRVAPELRLAELGERSGAVGAMIAALRTSYAREFGIPAAELDGFPSIPAEH